jgi:two-component system cell cycle sensor histidine kinase/response regulator CckA
MNFKEAILVVEDEPLVLQFLARVLNVHGYIVLQADTVDLAFDIAHTYDGIIGLLITDHHFLNTTGRHIAKRILHTRPDTKVLYISGDPREVLIDESSLSPSDAFLKKPFLPNILIAAVRDLLDSKAVHVNTRPWCLASVPY